MLAVVLGELARPRGARVGRGRLAVLPAGVGDSVTGVWVSAGAVGLPCSFWARPLSKLAIARPFLAG